MLENAMSALARYAAMLPPEIFQLLKRHSEYNIIIYHNPNPPFLLDSLSCKVSASFF
jgi:hypothetical protein